MQKCVPARLPGSHATTQYLTTQYNGKHDETKKQCNIMQQCQYIREKVAPFQRHLSHLSEPNVNGVSRKSPVSCAFLKLDTIRSSCFPKTSSKYLRPQWPSACQVGYRRTENTWPCRTSAEGTHQRKEDSHSQPQQNSTNVSNRTILCGFKYQNWPKGVSWGMPIRERFLHQLHII